MSAEAWGDEGNIPVNGEDTAIFQELLTVRTHFINWKMRNASDMPNDLFVTKVDLICDQVDEMLDELKDDK